MNGVELNKKMKLSEHFTLGELIKTSYYTSDGNIPSRGAIENLKRLCGWLEILRERYNTRYGDGFSPPESGGVRGCLLLDIADEKLHRRDGSCVPTVASEQSSSAYCVNFDELILEKRGTTYWVHFAVRPKDNWRKILFDCR